MKAVFTLLLRERFSFGCRKVIDFALLCHLIDLKIRATFLSNQK